jgi:FixJ family two-component response regulator
MTGFELQARLAVPAIFITSHDDITTRDGIRKSGAAGHLWKPFDEDTVCDAIRTALREAPT